MAVPTLDSKTVKHPQYAAHRAVFIGDETADTGTDNGSFGWQVDPVAASARGTYTQTYSTANRTVANPTGVAVAATLTDSTGLSGSHDDTLAATTVPADVTDNGGGAAADGTIGAITLTEPANLAAQAVINNQLADAVKELSTKLNAALAVIRIMAQNQSDVAQKVIELVTLANALVADDLDNRQSITAVIDDLQALGFVK